MRKYDIITVMDICVDFLIQCGDTIPEFGQKEKIINDYDVEMGGSCGIFACQAAKLGLKTAGIGVVGNDFFGNIVFNKLISAGVSTEYIKVDSTMKTGMGAALCLNGGDRAILTYMGTIDAVGPEDITGNILTSARHLHIGSFFLMNKIRTSYRDIVARAKKEGMTISLDTNWDPDENWDGGIQEILPYIDIFLPNENEIRAITRKDSIEDAILALSDKVPVIALKQGNRGASVYAGGKSCKTLPVNVPVVDTVGAGDSFDAGFVYGYLSGFDMELSLKIGCICGSLSTTRAGGISGQPRVENILELLEGSSDFLK